MVGSFFLIIGPVLTNNEGHELTDREEDTLERYLVRDCWISNLVIFMEFIEKSEAST